MCLDTGQSLAGMTSISIFLEMCIRDRDVDDRVESGTETEAGIQ
jgi:hypothetical protein